VGSEGRGDALALKVAAEVLHRLGAAVERAVRVPSYRNAVCLTDLMAVRVAGDSSADDLLVEARLAALLPPRWATRR
jgi:hypothetical protein